MSVKLWEVLLFTVARNAFLLFLCYFLSLFIFKPYKTLQWKQMNTEWGGASLALSLVGDCWTFLKSGWVVMLGSPLPCPCNLPRSDTPLCLTPDDHNVTFWPPILSPSIPPPTFPPLWSLLFVLVFLVFAPSLPTWIFVERALSSKTKEERNIYKCYKSIKKDYRDVKLKVERVIVKQSLCIICCCRGGMYRKSVLILYILNLNMWRSNRQIRDELTCDAGTAVRGFRAAAVERWIDSRLLSFSLSYLQLRVLELVTDMLLWMITTQL